MGEQIRVANINGKYTIIAALIAGVFSLWLLQLAFILIKILKKKMKHLGQKKWNYTKKILIGKTRIIFSKNNLMN